MRSLVLYTELPELWDIFISAIKIAPVSKFGYSLLGLQTYFEVGDTLLSCNKRKFWEVINYFLYRVNSLFMAKQKGGTHG